MKSKIALFLVFSRVVQTGRSKNEEKARNLCDFKKTILCAKRRKLLNVLTSKNNIRHVHNLRIRKQKYSRLKRVKKLKNHARWFKKVILIIGVLVSGI